MLHLSVQADQTYTPKDSSNRLTKPYISVRQGTDINRDEKEIVSKRMTRAKETLCKLLNRTLQDDTVPLIGIAASGGGYRAMISTLGFLMALEKYELLNAISYMATVSGSGWAMGPWIAHANSLSEFKDFLRNQISVDLRLHNFDWGSIAKKLFYKASSKQPVNECDVWGCLLSQILLKGIKKNDQDVTFSSLAPIVKTGNYPFPILTALLDDSSPYEWFEFSPFEIGSATSAAWVPTQGFGKQFAQGISTDSGQEQMLGYIMGLSGSAFAIPFTDILHSFMEALPKKCGNFENIFSGYFQGFIGNTNEIQLPPPTVFNFMKDLPGSPHATKDYLSFFDAGINVNIGVPPLLRRNVNVYLICDASQTATDDKNHTLTKVEAYARNNNFKFPKIDYTSIGTNKVSLFYDEQDPHVPIVLYFPNQVSVSTLKFSYDAQEFNQLYRYMKDTVEQSYEIICKGISIAIDNLTKIKT